MSNNPRRHKVSEQSVKLAGTLGIKAKCLMDANCPDDCHYCVDKSKCAIEEIFPDFEEPVNFVKLIQLFYGNVDFFGVLAYAFDKMTCRNGSFNEDFIDAIYEELQEYTEEFLSSVRQVACQVEWEY